MSDVEVLGKQAFQKQILGNYKDAISLYNSAIRKYSKDARLLNNRCCCYIKVKDYKRALEDAERMIILFPSLTKSYYRKGEVLSCMKRFIEAEEAFQKVLTLDPSCEDARIQLLEVQLHQLCKSGKYPRKQAQQALLLTKNNLEDAKKLLKCGLMETYSEDIDDIYYSDDDDDSKIHKGQEDYNPLVDPSNPLSSTSLWVGCITEAVSEKLLSDLFSKYGRIKSLHFKTGNHYAFINYYDSVTPAKVMRNLQGHMLSGQGLLIKFPDNTLNSGSAASTNNKIRPRTN